MDFDGTLKPFGGAVSPEDTETLDLLGRAGAVRAVATGRSISVFERDREPAFHIDYLISSSGLATSRYGPEGPGELIRSRSFTGEETRLAVELALRTGLGLVLALAPPENHRFLFRPPSSGPPLPGFAARVRNAGDDARPWDGRPEGSFAQLIAMGEPAFIRETMAAFNREAPGLSTVLSSSPYLDGSLWLEVFPAGVSKGLAAAELAASLGLGPGDAVALGNDYNDEDLLRWAGRAYVSSEAPEELRSLFPNMPPAGQAPLAHVAGRLIPGIRGL
ncbi:MAG: HAD hydrolase family protein [Deltaproteobacteria bacterium]|jgi:hydroxymethylpyrimidine pyrophosphatase-like HAD family hydrolase|nr:HAD hydrolase family protein [Deltaproteobacteria bacterium]